MRDSEQKWEFGKLLTDFAATVWAASPATNMSRGSLDKRRSGMRV